MPTPGRKTMWCHYISHYSGAFVSPEAQQAVMGEATPYCSLRDATDWKRDDVLVEWGQQCLEDQANQLV